MKKIAKLLATISAFAVIIFAGTVCAADLNIDGKIFAEQRSFVPPRIRYRFVPPINIGRRDDSKPAKVYPSRVPVRPTPRYLPSKPKPSHDKRGRFVPRAPRR